MFQNVINTFKKSDWDIFYLKLSLTVVFLFFGYAKWYEYEAHGLVPLIGNSPILSWLYSAFGTRGASYFLGTAEWTFGLFLFLGFWSRLLGLLGALGSTATFAVTSTLIFSTPNVWEASAGGFPAMAGNGGFLMKDIVLLGASIVLVKYELRRKD